MWHILFDLLLVSAGMGMGVVLNVYPASRERSGHPLRKNGKEQ